MKSSAIMMAAAATMAIFASRGEEITIGNDAMEIRFGDAESGFQVLGISNKLCRSAFIFEGNGPQGRLFSIDLRKAPNYWDSKYDRTISDRTPFREKRARVNEHGVTFDFLGANLDGEPGCFDVHVTVELERGCGRSHWSLEYENRATSGLVGFISRFPRFNHVARDGEADVLVPTSNHGLKLIRKHSNERDGGLNCYGCGYLGYKPMVTAFMKDGGGLYMAAEDPEARLKELNYDGHRPFFVTPLEIKRPPEGKNGPKYSVTVATFEGDWWAVARLYREWALKQEWTSKGRLIDRKDYPHRLCEIPYWVNIHASGQNLDKWMDRVRAAFPDYRIGLHWHSWHKPPHCHDYPDYYPARTGVLENVQHLKNINVEANVYLDSQLWTEGVGDWSNAVKYATMKPNGKDFNFERWAGVRNAVMCPATEFWQKEVQKFSMRVFDELKSDTIYQDQTGAAPGRTCYDASHGHAVGGGNWWYEGYKKMFAPLKERAVKMGGVITTEGTGEAYMAFIDGFLTVTDLKPDDVPFYNAVYSGYAYYYGSPQLVNNSDQSFWAVQTREFMWGNAIGWYSETTPNEAKREMVRRICSARVRLNDYFAYGQLLDELRPIYPLDTVRVAFSFRKKPIDFYMPKVNGNWWKNARNGKRGLVAVNLTGRDETINFNLLKGVEDLTAVELAGEATPEISVKDGVGTMKIAAWGLVFLEEK